MNQGLLLLVVVLALASLLSLTNRHYGERVPTPFLLVGTTLLLSVLSRVLANLYDPGNAFLAFIESFDFADFLMNWILGFMVFASASQMNLKKVKKHWGKIVILSLLGTGLGIAFFGGLLFASNALFSWGFGVQECFLWAAIMTPATAWMCQSLHKKGLSPDTETIIKGVTLFDSGLGIASSLALSSFWRIGNVPSLSLFIVREVFGGLGIGIGVALLIFFLIRRSRSPITHVLLSLLDVLLSYLLAQWGECSGGLACVAGGITLSFCFSRCIPWREALDPQNTYGTFWRVVDQGISDVLFVAIGLSFLDLSFSRSATEWTVVFLIPILVLLTRFLAVSATTFFLPRNLPEHFNRWEFSLLLSWNGSRGAVALALALASCHYLPNGHGALILLSVFSEMMVSIFLQGNSVVPLYALFQRKATDRFEQNFS